MRVFERHYADGYMERECFFSAGDQRKAIQENRIPKCQSQQKIEVEERRVVRKEKGMICKAVVF